ncbi:methionine gamma-lyase family protein [Capillibacterium thermochitinicola]|uniref:methionine gamma-lyase family protein n=1 Tax=Capillibacterium thermochitinicola TaxID=2699427 RepID=UPI0016529E55|nr:methionine gamma-lyase family protein [Capillibacterium thermochitinicola]
MSITKTSGLALIKQAEESLAPVFARFEELALYNQEKVLAAFKAEKVGAHHFTTSTGYGYGDVGRETLERVFARAFGAEAALVRQQIVSGTHAINLGLSGLLRPGDELVFATGLPYATLRTVCGLEGNVPGNLQEYGVKIKVIPLLPEGQIDQERLLGALTDRTRMVAFQRSCGYENRRSFMIKQLAPVFAALRQLPKAPIIFVDNCYGEFVEKEEPLAVGADLIAGSLIKNPGGGWVPSGGYLAGKKELIDLVAARLYAPGLGGEVGPSLMNLRLFFQGLFDAPHRVYEMLKAAALFAWVFAELGFTVAPTATEPRTDVIQRIDFGTPERLLAVCRSIQAISPVDSYLTPEPAAMPGYQDRVVMAAGTFINGSTSELTADAPFRPPYSLYFQGSLSYLHAKIALASILKQLKIDS